MIPADALADLRAALEQANTAAAQLPYAKPMLVAIADLLGEVDFLQAITAVEVVEE